VDGEKAEPVLVGNVMVGVELTEGTHKVTFQYHNAAFSLGWKISLVCLLVFGGVAYLVYRPRFDLLFKRKKGKYEKQA
jgi:uncharacterized membrane protein YfhO